MKAGRALSTQTTKKSVSLCLSFRRDFQLPFLPFDYKLQFKTLSLLPPSFYLSPYIHNSAVIYIYIYIYAQTRGLISLLSLSRQPPMAGLYSSSRPTSSSSSSSSFASSSSFQTFASRLLLVLTVPPLTLAAFAFVLQWRGGLNDPVTRWSPDRHEFPGMVGMVQTGGPQRRLYVLRVPTVSMFWVGATPRLPLLQGLEVRLRLRSEAQGVCVCVCVCVFDFIWFFDCDWCLLKFDWWCFGFVLIDCVWILGSDWLWESMIGDLFCSRLLVWLFWHLYCHFWLNDVIVPYLFKYDWILLLCCQCLNSTAIFGFHDVI